MLLLVLLVLLWASQRQKKVVVGPPVGTEAIGTDCSSGKIVRVVDTCGSWASSSRNPEGKQRGGNVLQSSYSASTTKKTRQHMRFHILVQDNTWAGQWPGP